MSFFSHLIQKSTGQLLKIESQVPKYAGFLYIIMFSFFFSIGSMFIKLLSRVPIYQQMHNSSLVSLCLCILVEPAEKVPKDPLTYKLLLQRGIIGSLGFFLYYQTLYLLPLSIGTLLFLINPLWLGILGVFLYHEVFGLAQFILTLSSFCGLLLIIQPEFLFDNKGYVIENYDETKFILGIIIGIIGSFVGAVAFLTIRSLKGKVSVILVLYYFNLFSVIVGALGSFFETAVQMEVMEILLVFLAGLFFFFAQAGRNRALFLEKPFIVASGSYLQVIISYLFDIFILDIELNFLANVGCVVVMVSMIILIYYDNKKGEAHEEGGEVVNKQICIKN